MGTIISKHKLDEKMLYNDTPIQVRVSCQIFPFSANQPHQFSQDVVNHLSDSLTSAATTPHQLTLESHIQSQIQAQLGYLREEEEHVRHEIERTLVEENRGRTPVGVKSGGTALLGDLEELQRKVDRFQGRRQLCEFPVVKANASAVISCYKCVKRS
jgi:altered-inheritance-of-mitochondria protein 13